MTKPVMRDATTLGRDHAHRRRLMLNLGIVIAVGIVAHLFRSSASAVAPDILSDFDLGSAWAAYLTSAFFLTAVLTQIPAGILFDSIGLRATIPLMLCIASVGALVFAAANGSIALLAGRALMGVGAGALIMGGLVLCAHWIAPERFPAVVGMILSLSQIGNIGATAPVALLSAYIGWRGAFAGLALFSIAIAIVYVVLVQERPPRAAADRKPRDSLAKSVRGSWRILRTRALWPVFAMAFVAYAAGFSMSGVWGGVYLNEVFGLGIVARGNILLLMVTAFALGLFFFGWLGAKLRSLKRAVMLGCGLMAALFALAAALPHPTIGMAGVWFVMLGATGGACGTIIPHGRNFYPPDSIGRGVTVLNTIVLLGGLCIQIVTGLLMDGLLAAGLDVIQAFRVLFLFHALALVLGLGFYSRARESALADIGTATI